MQPSLCLPIIKGVLSLKKVSIVHQLQQKSVHIYQLSQRKNSVVSQDSIVLLKESEIKVEEELQDSFEVKEEALETLDSVNENHVTFVTIACPQLKICLRQHSMRKAPYLKDISVSVGALQHNKLVNIWRKKKNRYLKE
ncbi:uncharacterized protein LOC122253377 [Penaeus japonicus]|uniref:uncharacterized protein LOC122253377 n=1 Tax=Penaeus japonicus TaxID=27405 RepID=UPI001C70CC1F|nr:uncharacterized protein LOC122253377 [Penaeus japonicus]